MKFRWHHLTLVVLLGLSAISWAAGNKTSTTAVVIELVDLNNSEPAVSCNWHSSTWWKNASPRAVKVCSGKKDVNFPDVNGRRPIHWATGFVPEAEVKTLKALLTTRGLKLNVADKEGRTAMHVAVRYRRGAIMNALLAAGADSDLPDKDGITPIMLAQAEGWKQTRKALTNHGATEVCTTPRKIRKKASNVTISGAIGCGVGLFAAWLTGGASMYLCFSGVAITLLPQAGDIVMNWDCDINIRGVYEIRF